MSVLEACENCGQRVGADTLRSVTQGPLGLYSDHTIELCPVGAENADWGNKSPARSATNRYDELDAVTRMHVDRLVNAAAAAGRMNRLLVCDVLTEATKRIHLVASQGLRTTTTERAVL